MTRACLPRRGFTMVELLVVIAIVAILIGLVLPAVQKVRETANRAACQNNLKQLALATHNYHDSLGYVPPVRHTIRGLSWFVLVMPYMEQAALRNIWNQNADYRDVSNNIARPFAVKSYFCPSRRSPATAGLNKQINNYPRDSTTPLVEGPGGPGADNTIPDRFQEFWNLPGALGDYAGNAGTVNVYNVPAGTGEDSDGPAIWNSMNAFNGVIGPGLLMSTSNFKGVINFKDVTSGDGMSNTFLVGEKHVPAGFYGVPKVGDNCMYSGTWPLYTSRLVGKWAPMATGPQDRDPSPNAPGCTISSCDGFYARKFGSSHLGVSQFVMCDGSLKVVRTSIDSLTYARLGMRNDGEVIGSLD